MNQQQNPDGSWGPAEEMPYQTHWGETVAHWFGRHIYYGRTHCLICHKRAKGLPDDVDVIAKLKEMDRN